MGKSINREKDEKIQHLSIISYHDIQMIKLKGSLKFCKWEKGLPKMLRKDHVSGYLLSFSSFMLGIFLWFHLNLTFSSKLFCTS